MLRLADAPGEDAGRVSFHFGWLLRFDEGGWNKGNSSVE